MLCQDITSASHLLGDWHLGLPLQHSLFHAMRGEIFPEFFNHHRFMIGPVADVHLRDGFAIGGDDVDADAVAADDQHSVAGTVV